MSLTDRIELVSEEYISRRVAFNTGCGFDDPSLFPVDFAFVAPGTTPPGTGGWHAGSWNTSCAPDSYFAEILIGAPGGVVLAVGTWAVHVRVTGSTEVPVKPAGYVIVY